MESADAFGSSTAPLTWHDFLERMRQPSASDFVKAIKSFIVSFMNNAPDPERDSAAVQEFLTNMEAAFKAHPLWAGCSEEELDSAGEGLEKYVMTKLYNRVFASHPDDVKIDEQLHEKMALIQQFIRPENLDILPTYQNETSWLLAQKELQKINMHKAPREKLACVLNCCKVISNLLLNASIAANENPPGADEFLPVLIYVTIKANPPQLHSNLLYIQRYRRQSRLVSEAAYFFTNILSAESFIQNIDGKSLSMDEAEYERNIEFAQALLSGLSTDHNDTLSQSDHSFGNISRSESIESRNRSSHSKKNRETTSSPSQLPPQAYEAKQEIGGPRSREDQVPFRKDPSISDLENKGATMLLKEEKMNKIFRDFPYLYSQSGDLTLSDVDSLLNSYKQLVFKYVSLATGLGLSTTLSPPPSSEKQSHADNLKESEDIREAVLNIETHIAGLNIETHIDSGKVEDDSDGVAVSGSENHESKLVQEEDASQVEGKEGISNG